MMKQKSRSTTAPASTNTNSRTAVANELERHHHPSNISNISTKQALPNQRPTAQRRFGAGGHPKAAAASIRLTSEDPETEARELIEGLVDTICKEQVSCRCGGTAGWEVGRLGRRGAVDARAEAGSWLSTRPTTFVVALTAFDALVVALAAFERPCCSVGFSPHPRY